MTRAFLICGLVAAVLLLALILEPQPSTSSSYPLPPSSIVICGIQDRPCATYAVSFHDASQNFGDLEGEGVTDYERKTISIARGKDRFNNVKALQHEVFHAVLWERGFRDTDKWDLHAWIYFSEGSFPLLFRDNPDLVKYITSGY